MLRLKKEAEAGKKCVQTVAADRSTKDMKGITLFENLVRGEAAWLIVANFEYPNC